MLLLKGSDKGGIFKMGMLKSLGLTALGVGLVSYAAHELGTPGLEDLAYELYDAVAYDQSLGGALSTIAHHIGYYTPDMFYDKEAFAGAAGYACWQKRCLPACLNRPFWL